MVDSDPPMTFPPSVAPLALILALSGAGSAQTAAPKQPPSFDHLSKLADTARQQNRLDDAIGYYRQALKVRKGWKDGWWYLGTLLSDPLGENTRNELLHGFVDDPAAATATLVFVGILFFTLRVEVRPRRDFGG